MDKKLIFSSFWLKVIALFTMTIDHVGLLLTYLFPLNNDIVVLSNIFRIIGRLALPLFVFMIVEGTIHTKSIKKYLLRLGIMATLISIFLAIVTYVPFNFDTGGIEGFGNIFLDLLLVAVTIYCLNHKNWHIKLLALLPLIFSIGSFAVKCYENSTHNHVLWFPEFLYLQYDFYSILLGIGFYAAYYLGNKYIESYSNKNGVDRYTFDMNGTTRFAINLIAITSLIIVTFIHYAMKYVWPSGVYWDTSIQLYAMFSAIFILFYNGKRGYNAKWFQYGSYLYYPLHLIIIIGIYLILG